MRKPIAWALLAAPIIACGTPMRTTTLQDAGRRDTAVVSITDSSIDPNGDCSDAARLVYVLSESNALYSFRPDQRVFTLIGTLDCDATAQPNSMAIDRNAVAWVNFVRSNGSSDTAGRIYQVSTRDGHCSSASPIDLPVGWFRIGMGFSTDATSGDAESLFVAATGNQVAGTSAGLARVDVASHSLVPVGQFTGSLRGDNAELTGTGDGRLYGFFTTSPVNVAQLDKTSGGVLSATALPAVETPSAWAFSFWGGSFYLYTAPDPRVDPTRTTNVTRYNPANDSTDTSYLTNIGFRIVGAGVSTCAPITPPG